MSPGTRRIDPTHGRRKRTVYAMQANHAKRFKANMSIIGKQTAIYTWVSRNQRDPEINFYDIDLTFIAGNGNLNENKDYFISLLTYGVIAGDKTYVFSQPTNATPWVVFHGLNKFPSVSVVNTANITVYGEVEYDSLNQVTISFNDATNGKAYFN